MLSAAPRPCTFPLLLGPKNSWDAAYPAARWSGKNPLRNEVVLLTGRLEDARERARGGWGMHFVQLAMEDFRAQFGDVTIPSTILEEDEEDEASGASTVTCLARSWAS